MNTYIHIYIYVYSFLCTDICMHIALSLLPSAIFAIFRGAWGVATHRHTRQSRNILVLYKVATKADKTKPQQTIQK